MPITDGTLHSTKGKELIEDKLDRLLRAKWKPMRFGNFEYWKWHGQPGFLSSKATIPKPIDIDIGRIVLEADAADCLTSSSEYIRELKKWFEQHSRKDYAILFKCYDAKGIKWSRKS